MKFLCPLIILWFALLECSVYAQQFQKRFPVNTGSNFSYVYNAFTPLSNNGFAILNAITGPSLKLQVVKLDAQGGLLAESFINIPSQNVTSYLPTIIEGEQGSLYCAVGLGSNIERYVLVYKLDNNMNVLWSRKVVSSPFYQLVQMAKCGSKVYTINRHVKRHPGIVLPNVGEYQENGFLLTGFSENGNLTLCKSYLSDSISINGFTGIFSNNANNLLVTAPAGLNYMPGSSEPTFFSISEIDTNGALLYSKTIKGIHPFYLQQQSNGNYLISGYKVNSSGPCVGIFDNNFNPIWIKEIQVDNNSWGGMCYIKDNEVYIYTKLTSENDLLPAFMKLDMNGNPIDAYTLNDTLSQHYSSKLTYNGRHALVGSYSAYIEEPVVKIRVADSASGAGLCNATQLCMPQVADVQCSFGSFSYRVADYDSIYDLQFNEQYSSIAIQDYCNPVSDLNAAFTLADDSICVGELIDFTSASNTGQGVHTWIVSGPVQDTIMQRNVGDYTFTLPGVYTVKHMHQLAYCVDSMERTLIVEGEVPPAIVSTCDTVFKADVTTACSIIWPDGSNGNFYVPPASGSRQVQLSCGACVSNHNVNFNIVEPPKLVPDTIEMCLGNALMINYQDTAYVQMVWADGYVGRQRFITQHGIYPVFITGTVCSGWDTLVVTNTVPDASFALSKDTVCINEAFDAVAIPEANDDDSYWMVNGPGFGESFAVKDLIGLQIPSAGVYNIFHRHIIGGCNDTMVKQVVVKGGEAPSSLTICDTVYASAITTTCSVLWYDGSTEPYYVPNATESEITVAVSCDGCGELFVIALNKLPQPVLQEHELDICKGSKVLYSIADNALQWAIWGDGVSGMSRTIDSAGVYTVLMNNGTCTVHDSLTVIAYDCDGCVLYIPNAFSPNGDGNNDAFTAYTNCPIVEKYSIEIYNRIGEKVFESNDIATGWDGSYKGNDAPVDVYVYQLQMVSAASKDYETKNYKGSFTLLR